MWLYAATIVLSAFLLFQVQPLMGKYILPWFGGAPAVWTTCMLFFQTMLLAGYAYAHLARTWLGERGQALGHMAVLAAALLLLPIEPSATWKPEGGADPTWRILAVLATGVGLPYFALAATSPLVQAWFSVAKPAASPYRLYALSNAGSLLALATYPLVVEPALRLRTQTGVWSALFAAFAVLCAGCALRAWRRGPAPEPATAPATDGEAAPRPGLMVKLLWLALPACGSVMLLAVTNQMCADVGVFPFLWVLPLGLYLLSFILCFHSDRTYWRPVFWPLLLLAVAGMIWLLYENVYASMILQIVGFSAGLFICCMVCHGELARLKPHPRYLTSFYLASSAGGAVGGLLVTLVAPLVFRAYFELHVGLWACLALAAIAFWREKRLRQKWRRWWALPLAGVGCMTVLAGAAVALALEARYETENSLMASRNFYGVLQVLEYNADSPQRHYYSLVHGRIVHGSQYSQDPLRHRPVTYFGVDSGVGLAILYRRIGKPIKIGVVGLGTGTLAAYGGKGDTVRFYEINPEVRRLATSQFTYLADSAARCEVIMGDARLSLEREPPQDFDVLVLDAFSSDAIPIHLLTEEAFDIYRRHLKPDGVLAVHVSNRFLDLKPVVYGAAEHFGMAAALINADDEGKEELVSSSWILVTRDKAFLQEPAIQGPASEPDASPIVLRHWTDDYSDLFRIIRWAAPDWRLWDSEEGISAKAESSED